MDLNAEVIKAQYLKLPDYQKALISLALILVLGGIYVYFLYMPMMDEVSKLEKELVDLQTKVSQVRAVADELPRFEAEHKKIKEKLTAALTQLPASDEIPKLLIDMENRGKDAGVEFKSLKLGREKKKDFYADVPISLSIVGTYHDVAVFFDKLSKLPRIMNISDIAIGTPKKEEGKMFLQVNCTATTYKFLDANKKVAKGGK